MRNTSRSFWVRLGYRPKRSDFSVRDVVLAQNNARHDAAALPLHQLELLGWKTLEPHSCTQDPPPCKLHVFGALKVAVGGERYNDDTGIEVYIGNYLQTRPIPFYKEGISKLPIRCVSKVGEYVGK